VLLALLTTAASRAEVTHIDVTARADVLNGKPFGLAGAYERLTGKVHFAVDPSNEHNRIIVDVDRAPRDRRGRVEFSADLYVLKPKDMRRGNGALLFEVSNRGGKGMLSFFNHGRGSSDPTAAADFGDGFLLRHGFTLVWLGWQFDVPHRPGVLRLDAPVATEHGKPITGLVRHDFVPATRVYDWPLAHGYGGNAMHPAYPLLRRDNPENTLTVRDSVLGDRRVLPRQGWGFGRLADGRVTADTTHVWLTGGFEAGKIYEVIYRSQNPAVVGLGLAAVRDLISFFKYRPDAPAAVRRAYGFGISQSGRLLRHFLYQGFNADEHGRRVFDGVLAHVAASGRGSFNHRFAQPSRDANAFGPFFYPTTIFPFSDVEQTDPETGLRDGLMTRAKAAGVLPKVFYTNGSNEYYGRAASLIHTTLDGKADVPVPDNVRIYFVAGTGHGAGPFPPAYSTVPEFRSQQKLNPNDMSWPLRALLLAMDRWVSDDTPPPPSRYPRVADGTLVRLEDLAFPKVPGVRLPYRVHQAYRVDYGPRWSQGIIDREPPRVGKPFVSLVPQVDRDGNEPAGIRLPDVAVPRATYTGWNLRDPRIGAPREAVHFYGSYIPFARTRAERQRGGDPRPSVEERYRSRAEYLGRVAEELLPLVRGGYLLAEDVAALLSRAREHWDDVQKRGH
jgi:hypothetical protein